MVLTGCEDGENELDPPVDEIKRDWDSGACCRCDDEAPPNEGIPEALFVLGTGTTGDAADDVGGNEPGTKDDKEAGRPPPALDAA